MCMNLMTLLLSSHVFPIFDTHKKMLNEIPPFSSIPMIDGVDQCYPWYDAICTIHSSLDTVVDLK